MKELYETLSTIMQVWTEAENSGMSPEEADEFFTKQIEQVSQMSYMEAMNWWEENHEPVEDLQNHYIT